MGVGDDDGTPLVERAKRAGFHALAPGILVALFDDLERFLTPGLVFSAVMWLDERDQHARRKRRSKRHG